MATAVQTLTHIARTHRHKLMATFALVATENLLFVLYPLVGSFAVNAVLSGDTVKALAYALMVFAMWAVGSARRAVDTRAFVRIYASLAVPAILNQKQKGTTSTATAQANGITAATPKIGQVFNVFDEALPQERWWEAAE